MERVMHPWDRIYAYFLERGFPEDLLDFVCIHREEALQIDAIIQEKQPRVLLEIGSFIGLSTGVLALTSPPQCTIVSVDPNFPVGLLSPDVHYFEGERTLFFLKKMLQDFNVSSKVEILEGYFSYASSVYRDRFIARGGDPQLLAHQEVAIVGSKARTFAPYDLAFLDGDHSTEVVYSDLLLIQKYLAKDGIIILHDAADQNYWEPYIRAAVMRFRDDFPAFRFDRRGNLGFLSMPTDD